MSIDREILLEIREKLEEPEVPEPPWVSALRSPRPSGDGGGREIVRKVIKADIEHWEAIQRERREWARYGKHAVGEVSDGEV